MLQVGGFGNGEFDWTTTDDSNVFVDQEGLHIVPTLTTETTSITSAEITNGYTLNLTKAGGDGTCTGTTNEACSVHSNSTLGTVINPVRSARLNTNGSRSITYGRVEVVARLPAGDWLWPAICEHFIPCRSSSGIETSLPRFRQGCCLPMMCMVHGQPVARLIFRKAEETRFLTPTAAGMSYLVPFTGVCLGAPT